MAYSGQSSYYSSYGVVPYSSTSSYSSYIAVPTTTTAGLASTTSVASVSTTASSANSHSTASTTATPKHSNGVSTGTLAGAIVGSIVGAALLAFLAAWLLFRRSKNTRNGSDLKGYDGRGGYVTAAAIGKTGAAAPKTTVVAGTGNDQILAAASLARYIPEPAGDESVVKRVLTFFDQASLHVDNYYSQAPSLPPNSGIGASTISDFDTPYLPGSLNPLLNNPTTRRLIITHALVYSLLQAIQPQSAARESLLPLPFAIGPLKSSQESSQAFYTWRMLTAHLFQAATPEAAQRNLAVQDAAIQNFVETFTSSFAPYADPAHLQGDRVRHLGTVMTTAADLGRWLFAQPCTFEFVYTAGNGEIVVLPAIVKVLDEQGKRLANKVVLCEAVTAKL